MCAKCRENDVFEALAGSLIEVREDLFAHAGIPETADVIGDACDALFFIGLGVEEVSDAVRLLHEMVDIHSYGLVTTR